MKPTALLLLMALPLLVLMGCTSGLSDGGDETRTETETEPGVEVRHDLVGMSYYWSSGSLAGTNRTYIISKDSTGAFLFHAEIEPEGLVVDKEISQEEFDGIAQMVNDNYLAEANAEAEDPEDEYVLLDGDSTSFEVTFADGKTQFIELSPADKQVFSQLGKLLEESSAK